MAITACMAIPPGLMEKPLWCETKLPFVTMTLCVL
jgi:hypothetical protein